MATHEVVVFWWAHRLKKAVLKGMQLVGRIDRKQ